MMQNHQFAILVSLAVGVGAVECTIFVHALAVGTTVNFFRHEKRRGRPGAGALKDLGNYRTGHISCVRGTSGGDRFVGSLCSSYVDEFQELGTAYYHSAVNYTTLGYGDLLMTPAWRLLGPLEATNGALLFGVSAAMVFAVVQRLVLARFEDLRN